VHNNMPPEKHLTALSQLQITVKRDSISSSHPIPKTTMAFSDANETRYGVLIQKLGNFLPNFGTVQLFELFVLLKIFECCQQEPVKISSDIQYVVQAVHTLSCTRLHEIYPKGSRE